MMKGMDDVVYELVNETLNVNVNAIAIGTGFVIEINNPRLFGRYVIWK